MGEQKKALSEEELGQVSGGVGGTPPSANVIEAASDPAPGVLNAAHDPSYMGNAHGRDSDTDRIKPR